MMRAVMPNLPACLVLLFLGTPVQVAAGDAEGGQSLEQAANDPSASLANVQIQNIYTGSYRLVDNEEGNKIQLRAAVPFKTGDINRIARITLPYTTDSPSGESGLGDAVLFDLIVFDKLWGRRGIGPVALLPTARSDALGAGQWAIGPAIGFVAAKPGLLLGVFNQNLFSVAGDDDRDDVGISVV